MFLEFSFSLPGKVKIIIMTMFLFWCAVGVLAGWGFGLAMVPACLLILARHREKARALLLGTEPRHYWRAKS